MANENNKIKLLLLSLLLFLLTDIYVFIDCYIYIIFSCI